MNFPERFGFEPDLRKCVGKTIELVEIMQMEHGSVWPQAMVVKFKDGSRAFFGGRIGTGIMNPRLDGKVYAVETVETSHIFTAEERRIMLEDRQQKAINRQREHDAAEKRQYDRLRAKFERK